MNKPQRFAKTEPPMQPPQIITGTSLVPEPQPQNDTASLMSAIARAASDPRFDVTKMERLWAMYEKMQAMQAAKEYAQAMSDTQGEIPTIIKDRTNKQTSSDYATLDAINKAIVPIYARHGLSLSFDNDPNPPPGEVRILCHVSHAGGHTRTFHYDNPMDDAGIAGTINKTPTHARGSSTTYAKRYITCMIFNIATGKDDDGNGAGKDQPADEKTMAKVNDFETAIRDAVDETELSKIGADVTQAGFPPKLQARVRECYRGKLQAIRKAAKP